MSRFTSFGNRLYHGEVSYDFVGHQRRWYAISGVILLVALLGLGLRGLNLGIEFKGGAEFRVPAGSTCSITSARTAVSSVYGTGEVIVQQLQNGQVRVQTGPVGTAESDAVTRALAQACGVAPNDIQIQVVGPTWGAQITQKAVTGLIVFLVLVVLFLSVYFEWKMALAAIVALVHDVVITVGIYALSGFDVTPSTVIGLLTILGYSLYDTVVVFDKVKENTTGLRAGSRMTYAQAANLAVNQTLVRSINTSVIALLPVGAILFVGAGLLGAGTLKDLALALFVGIAAGTYSSIFIATPLLADLKEREPDMQALARRVAARQASAVPAGVTAGGASREPSAAPATRTDRTGGDTEAADAAGEAPAPGSGARPTARRATQRRPAGRPSARKRRR